MPPSPPGCQEDAIPPFIHQAFTGHLLHTGTVLDAGGPVAPCSCPHATQRLGVERVNNQGIAPGHEIVIVVAVSYQEGRQHH